MAETRRAPGAARQRTPPPHYNPPNDEAFTPGRQVLTDPGGAWDAGYLMFESNAYKITHYRAFAQTMSTTLNCAVLLHYYIVPGFQRTGPTLMAVCIPSDPNIAVTPDPA